MTANEVVCRHFSRMGARLKIRGPDARQQEKVRIDVATDSEKSGARRKARTAICSCLLVIPERRKLDVMPSFQ
jgi:hypothetical protein